MAKTPEEVQAKLQRRLANTAEHIVGLIDKNVGLRKDVQRLEELLVWIYRKNPPIEEIRETLDARIPARIKREQEAGRL